MATQAFCSYQRPAYVDGLVERFGPDMIAKPMHFSLSLDLVNWRATLWMKQQRHSDGQASVSDDRFTLRTPTNDESASNNPASDSRNEPSRFVRQPVRIVYTPRPRPLE